MKRCFSIFTLFAIFLSFNGLSQKKQIAISGIYPHLAMYNNEGECGTGAVVPWANKLWVITYGPHMPNGSSDKLYEISDDKTQIIRDESIGGTPANRMIHSESNQLLIGPYAISATGNVRAIPSTTMMGRLTGNARHLSNPSGKIYYATMEEGFYEVDVNTLEVKTLYEDAHKLQKKGDMSQYGPLLPGAHGKGLYTGQGVMVFSNNGEANLEALDKFDVPAGTLAEWNGKDWTVVRRNQFVEVTGPGGIYGNSNPQNDPIWATGWDHKSVLLGVKYKGEWSFFRMPKASHSYDGAHGWNTEWPRIRDIGTSENPDYLMTMHGLFWRFPKSFTSENTAGIRPRSAYLKVIGDFALWNNQLVFGCDDAAQKEFLNKRSIKGKLEGPGQSNSNLWFTSINKPDSLGPNTAEGAVWINEEVEANAVSEPFLFAGWKNRMAWIKNSGEETVKFSFEIDEKGSNNWVNMKAIEVKPHDVAFIDFEKHISAEWIRVITNKKTKASVHFSYTQTDMRGTNQDKMFNGLAPVSSTKAIGGLLYGLGNNRRTLGILVKEFSENNSNETGYYELDGELNLVPKIDTATENFIREKFEIPQNVLSVEKSSVLIIDGRNRRWRLPLGDENFTSLTNSGSLRICREVSTERDLMNCHGTFYELPAENADGFAKIRPVASHNFRIHDYACYRGLLIMTGIDKNLSKNNPHVISSADGKASVWAGAIDDLWKLGKPTGKGGPLKNDLVKANTPSDAYLIGFYDKKELTISHNSDKAVTFTIEVEPIGHGPWMKYKTVSVKAGKTFRYVFPESFQARWIRFVADTECHATTWLEYK